jgi:hypothetical protein
MGLKMAAISRDVQVITQRLSLGKEVIMAAVKRSKKAAVDRRVLRIKADSSGLYMVDAQMRTKKLAAIFGNNSLARIIQVNQSQTSRWSEGDEQASVINQQKLIDLDYVIDQLSITLYPDQIQEWLQNPNAHLGGAAPIHAFQVNGLTAVLPAISALSTGAFA